MIDLLTLLVNLYILFSFLKENRKPLHITEQELGLLHNPPALKVVNRNHKIYRESRNYNGLMHSFTDKGDFLPSEILSVRQKPQSWLLGKCLPPLQVTGPLNRAHIPFPINTCLLSIDLSSNGQLI